jgi:hypothetical protein
VLERLGSPGDIVEAERYRALHPSASPSGSNDRDSLVCIRRDRADQLELPPVLSVSAREREDLLGRCHSLPGLRTVVE